MGSVYACNWSDRRENLWFQALATSSFSFCVSRFVLAFWFLRRYLGAEWLHISFALARQARGPELTFYFYMLYFLPPYFSIIQFWTLHYAANAVPFIFTMGASFLFGYAVFTHRKAVSIQLVGFNNQNFKLKCHNFRLILDWWAVLVTGDRTSRQIFVMFHWLLYSMIM